MFKLVALNFDAHNKSLDASGGSNELRISNCGLNELAPPRQLHRWASRNMNRKPKCIIITGRAGAGKTTLSKKLGQQLWMPVISRDEIKEGYVNTYGVKHDQLSPDTDGI